MYPVKVWWEGPLDGDNTKHCLTENVHIEQSLVCDSLSI